MSLRSKMNAIRSGAPRGTLEYVTNGYAVDETGKPYHVESVEQRETRRRIMAQKGEGRTRSFVWNRMENITEVTDNLTPAQCGHLLVLSSFINYNGLLVKSENVAEAMSTEDMQKVLRLEGSKSSTFYDFLNACESGGIIEERAIGHYYVNSRFHFRGKTEGDRVVKSYITRLREMSTSIGAHNTGILYRMLPYVHVDTNILCANPDEQIPKLIRKLNRKELAEATGLNVGTISRVTGRLIFEGHPVFANIRTATDGAYYMLNPSIFERKVREYTTTEKAIFGLD